MFKTVFLVLETKTRWAVTSGGSTSEVAIPKDSSWPPSPHSLPLFIASNVQSRSITATVTYPSSYPITRIETFSLYELCCQNGKVGLYQKPAERCLIM